MSKAELQEEVEDLLNEIDFFTEQIAKVETSDEVRRYLELKRVVGELQDKLKQIVKKWYSKYSPLDAKFEGNYAVATISPTRRVNVDKLKKIVGKDPTEIKGLAKVTVSVSPDKLMAAIEAGTLPEEAKKAIEYSPRVYVSKRKE